MATIELRSPAFNNHDVIPSRYTGDHDNVSPALQWSGVPAGSAELVLLCEDPDAPGGTFLHWLVTGIDPHTGGVGEGEVPRGGQQRANGFGKESWSGPQPPRGDGTHRYFFRLYALPQPIRLPANASLDAVHRFLDESASASGATVGVYER